MSNLMLLGFKLKKLYCIFIINNNTYYCIEVSTLTFEGKIFDVDNAKLWLIKTAIENYCIHINLWLISGHGNII